MPKPRRMTTENLSKLCREAKGEEGVAQLELLFTELQISAKRETNLQRMAAEAQAEAQIAAGIRSKNALTLLRYVSEFSELLATEHNWMMPYRKGDDGEILIDNPMTSVDVRAVARAEHKRHTQAVDPDDFDLFEGEGH